MPLDLCNTCHLPAICEIFQGLLYQHALVCLDNILIYLWDLKTHWLSVCFCVAAAPWEFSVCHVREVFEQQVLPFLDYTIFNVSWQGIHSHKLARKLWVSRLLRDSLVLPVTAAIFFQDLVFHLYFNYPKRSEYFCSASLWASCFSYALIAHLKRGPHNRYLLPFFCYV